MILNISIELTPTNKAVFQRSKNLHYQIQNTRPTYTMCRLQDFWLTLYGLRGTKF